MQKNFYQWWSKKFLQNKMRIVNEILLKIIEKTKEQIYKNIFWILNKLLKIREDLCTLLNIWDINDKKF